MKIKSYLIYLIIFVLSEQTFSYIGQANVLHYESTHS
jgi:hypothetical protein